MNLATKGQRGGITAKQAVNFQQTAKHEKIMTVAKYAIG
jgi:hypothetical protein